MNNHHHQQDMYYDQASSRSPGSHRHQQQTLHRQPSRQFDAYGQMPSTLFTPDDHGPRYDTNRFDRMTAAMQGGGYGYDPSGSQSWNPGAFGGGNHFHNFGATGRMKSTSRGRSTLPTVRSALRTIHSQFWFSLADAEPRHGLINNNHQCPQ